MQGSLAFVIPVRNDARRLAACLASIPTAEAPAGVRVVVVDHASEDDSAAVASRLGAEVLEAPPAAPNVAALRNAGVRQAQTDLVAFVDADHELKPGWVSAAIEAMGDDNLGAIGAPCHAPPSPTWVQAWFDALRDHSPGRRPEAWFGAGNLVVRRTAFDAVGGFDESLESCEDVDLCFRLRRAGWSLLRVPDLRNVHFGDPATLGRLFRSELWRGRDNIRVSLRERPVTLRNAVSALVPVMQLVLVAAATVVTVAGVPLSGVAAGSALVALAVTPTLGRAVAIWRRAPRAPHGLAGALAFAGTYDAARAVALVVRAAHHSRPAGGRA